MKKVNGFIKSVIIVVLAAAVVVLPIAFRGNDSSYHSPTYFAMDTTLDVTIQGRSKKTAQADALAALESVKKLESITSRFVSSSDVFRINANAGTGPVTVSRETLTLIESSIKYAEITQGAFDITVAPVAKLWGFYDQRYRVPSPDEISRAIGLVDDRKIVIDHDKSTVMLSQPGMEIDLGGIAKGYAVGSMERLLEGRGVKSSLINFGGAVGAIGRRIDGKPWIVGIKNPRGAPEDLLGELKIQNAYVSSSGDYERYFMSEGKRYCHIFDPATGRQPAGAISVTVVGPNSETADILSTAMFVLGPEKGISLVESQEGYYGLVVDGSGHVNLSNGFRGKYVITIKEKL